MAAALVTDVHGDTASKWRKERRARANERAQRRAEGGESDGAVVGLLTRGDKARRRAEHGVHVSGRAPHGEHNLPVLQARKRQKDELRSVGHC